MMLGLSGHGREGVKLKDLVYSYARCATAMVDQRFLGGSTKVGTICG
jgi:hypothetical protein